MPHPTAHDVASGFETAAYGLAGVLARCYADGAAARHDRLTLALAHRLTGQRIAAARQVSAACAQRVAGERDLEHRRRVLALQAQAARAARG